MKIAKTDKSIKCAMFPSPYLEDEWARSQHPLLPRIAQELQQLNYECVPTPHITSIIQWLITNYQRINIIHLHWPEQLYNPVKLPRWIQRLQKITNYLKLGNPTPVLYFLYLWIFLTFLRLIRVPLVWTLHDLYPHGESHLDRHHKRSRKLLMSNVKVLIVNCCSAKQLAVQEFGHPRHIIIAPLGDYREFYPDSVSTDVARQFLGINVDEVVFLYFGTMRKNRNALSTVQAFRQIQNKNLRLLVCGRVGGTLRDEIEKEAWGDWRIRCFFQVIPNEQIEYLLKASDFVVMPGIQYLTSAVVPLALSYHRPVIVPKYGCAIDMVGNAGILYDDCDPDGLINAMEQAVQLNRDHYKFLAQQRAKLFSWKLTAQQIAKAYEIACQT